MNIIPFSGNSVTLASTSRNITKEDSSISKPSFLSRILKNKSKLNVTLEEVVDVEKDLEIYHNHHIELLNPKILYKTGNLSFNSQLLRINREEEILVTTNEVRIPLVSLESIRKIKESGKRLVHLGLIVIGIRGLVRKEIPVIVLITLMDKGWKSDARNALIAAVKVDMSCNSGLFYCSPDFLISVRDLNLIEIRIQARGYDDLVKHSNFLINVGFIGKLTDTSTTRYKLDVSGIVSAISSKGVRMIKPMITDSSEFNGLEWNLSKGLEQKTVIPKTSLIYKDKNNNYSIRFGNYKEIPVDDRPLISSLEEEFESIND